MKEKLSLLLAVMQVGRKQMSAKGALPLAFLLLGHGAMAQEVNLGTANNFAVLAGAAISDTGSSVISGGNVGVSPGTAITGFPPATVTPPYTTFSAGAIAAQAEIDLTSAYNTAAGLAPSSGGNLTGQDLGGLTLTPGVYFFSSAAQLTGTLTLNGEGLLDPVFVFQIGSTLTTASASSVITINDDGSTTPGISVFWQIGDSATLGTATAFEGNILALNSITADTGATDLDGRLLARNGAVTLDDNAITAPPAEVIVTGEAPDTGSTILLLTLGFGVLIAWRRRCFQFRSLVTMTVS